MTLLSSPFWGGGHTQVPSRWSAGSHLPLSGPFRFPHWLTTADFTASLLASAPWDCQPLRGPANYTSEFLGQRSRTQGRMGPLL